MLFPTVDFAIFFALVFLGPIVSQIFQNVGTNLEGT